MLFFTTQSCHLSTYIHIHTHTHSLYTPFWHSYENKLNLPTSLSLILSISILKLSYFLSFFLSFFLSKPDGHVRLFRVWVDEIVIHHATPTTRLQKQKQQAIYLKPLINSFRCSSYIKRNWCTFIQNSEA